MRRTCQSSISTSTDKFLFSWLRAFLMGIGALSELKEDTDLVFRVRRCVALLQDVYNLHSQSCDQVRRTVLKHLLQLIWHVRSAARFLQVLNDHLVNLFCLKLRAAAAN